MSRFLSLVSLFVTLVLCSSASLASDYLIGKGMADVTGPAYGSPMWGFSKEGQNTEGVHNRLKSRAFIFADPKNPDQRLLFASVDIGSIEHHVTLEVIDRLKKKYGDLYHLDNVILSATHTHAGPAGYWHSRFEFAISAQFYKKHFERIVSGIVQSIEIAHENMKPGRILINKGDVEGAGANRSLIAYLANPERERARYDGPMDKEMTLLRLDGESGAMGLINWFAVHPTAMTFNSRLISGDHKGYASLTWELAEGVRYDQPDDFIAAFAQSTPGDITPNLNLDNTGPGETDIETTRIIGQRQLDVALDLFQNAQEPVTGPVGGRQIYVDMSNQDIDGNRTCPSAYGYAFAAGSTEDGGGHFLFHEGMKEQKWWMDFLIQKLTGAPEWTKDVKDCQYPKAILFETGSGDVPLQSQIRSVSVVRLGSLAIVALPAEVTTMAARRFKEIVKSQLGSWAKHVVIAGYSNGYAGYITTPEEYDTQQYEGGHTLHGKWSLPAYARALTVLSQSLDQGTVIDRGPAYDDWRGKAASSDLTAGWADRVPSGSNYGDPLPLAQLAFAVGDVVEADFWSGNPSTAYRSGDNFLQIDRKVGEGWETVHGDMDWSTIITWREKDKGLIARVQWTIPEGTASGTYRIRHLGHHQAQGQIKEFEAVSSEFEVR